MQINAYAAPDVAQPLEAFTYEADNLEEFGAEIEISHCGVCHSDVHLMDGDWGPRPYPMVPGHEIIGTVTAVGTAADETLVGKRVGIGWQRGSCLSCEWCIQGQENLCAHSAATCVNNYGGFAEKITLDSRFLHLIPDTLASENAAPLLCAGITVYAPLSRYADHTMRVGIIGIGGLGHLALQFANRMGCAVAAFSTRDSKKDEAFELGAHDFIHVKDEDALKNANRSFDLIINTAPVNFDLEPYLSALRPNGTLCFVANPPEPISLRAGRIFHNKAIAGSTIGGRHLMRTMLMFAARHNIVSWTEKLPMDDVNTAVERLRKHDVRYRFVLEN